MTQSSKTRRQVNAVLGILAVLIGAVVAGCNSFAPPTTLASPMVEATTGSSATVSVEPSPMASPSGTPEPFPVSEATVIEVTRRASYAERATQAVRDGQPTLEPYETIWARETSFQLERTQFAESLFTPTPFGALPFPGTRLTDEELAERGWPRMGPGGIRNEDYHTTAFWLDKEYVDAEIFSKYEALFDLLAFRDGPPGEDFEARLGELMIVDKAYYSEVSATLSENRDFANLASCGFDALLKNVLALEDEGAYLTYDWVLANTKLVWDYGDPLQSPPTILTDKLTAFEANTIYFTGFRMQGAPPDANESATIRFTIKSVATGAPVGSWLATYDPFIDTRYDAAVVWVSEAQSWKFLSLGSQFCDSVYPDIITKHLGN